jgi:hypothetical protein
MGMVSAFEIVEGEDGLDFDGGGAGVAEVRWHCVSISVEAAANAVVRNRIPLISIYLTGIVSACGSAITPLQIAVRYHSFGCTGIPVDESIRSGARSSV